MQFSAKLTKGMACHIFRKYAHIIANDDWLTLDVEKI
jgi:hypothetical protein